MDTTETDANGYILLEYEDEWNEERHGAPFGRRPKRLRQRLRVGTMEKEALILRARAELAKLSALYASDDIERLQYEGRARAYEAQARELEDSLTGWRI